MKTYRVVSLVTISIYTDVEARSTGEAKKLAMERGMVSLCHSCARGDPGEEWVTSGELDGEPQDVSDIYEVTP